MLLIACCAVLAGARSYPAIGQWARKAPQDTLARLGAAPRGLSGCAARPRPRPSAGCIDRVCPGGLADLLGHDPAGAEPWPWTARAPAARAPAPLRPPTCSSADHRRRARPSAQLRVPDKTNEITASPHLLDPFDLAGVTVTADALHTQRDHARFLVEDKKAHYAPGRQGEPEDLYERCAPCPGTR